MRVTAQAKKTFRIQSGKFNCAVFEFKSRTEPPRALQEKPKGSASGSSDQQVQNSLRGRDVWKDGIDQGLFRDKQDEILIFGLSSLAVCLQIKFQIPPLFLSSLAALLSFDSFERNAFKWSQYLA